MTTPKEFLGGGGRAPSAKFANIGSTVSGVIKFPPVMSQQTTPDGEDRFWPDGKPMEQLEVTVLTDDRDPDIDNDDGTRCIFVKSYMKNAVADAVRDAGASDLDVGGSLTVTFVDTQPAKQRGFAPAKLFKAQYTPPLASATSSKTQYADDEEPF